MEYRVRIEYRGMLSLAYTPIAASVQAFFRPDSIESEYFGLF